MYVYHVVDEYSSYYGLTPDARRHTEELEKRMIAFADLVIVVSRRLYESKRQFNSKTYLVPNGVNYEAYTAALKDSNIPEGLRVIKTPRLGYSGLIGDRLNFDMLIDMAQRHPEWSLVFVGEVLLSQQTKPWETLLALPNVHYLGQVPVTQVPHYIKGFQVGLMPYLQDLHAENIDPLKLYDYLAAGIPVASIDIPAAREFSRYIHLADSCRDFAETVRTALADTAPERSSARRKIAVQHTWEARAQHISELIQAHLAEKAIIQRKPA
jgi:glycosyltransferase involved in cell wall biosynthesis